MARSDQGALRNRKEWSTPRLEPLAADLRSVAGNRFPPGDGNSGSGKSIFPPGS